MPRPANPSSRGAALAQRLRRGAHRIRSAPRAGSRTLPILHGVTPGGLFEFGQENVLADARTILVESRRLFSHGNGIVMRAGEGAQSRILTLASDSHVEPVASALLANLLVCEYRPASKIFPVQFAPPKNLVELLLNNEPTRHTLPRIETYATRPVFDADYGFRGSGWYPDQGILVHCDDIEPLFPAQVPTAERALDRLPPALRAMLGDFCFRSDADVANTLGAMLTGLLANHFLTTGKGLVLLDGNQPGLGKSYLARAIGIILDGAEPDLIHYTADDEELAKRICATLKARSQTLVIDNAKIKANTAVSSPVLEANSMAPHISLRILGQSTNMTRPNDLLWIVTMNDTKTSPDLVSRGLPIRLFFEGNPGERQFGQDPLVFAHAHRSELLGELSGMIVRWVQAGRPRFGHRHRCAEWAAVIGGILQVNGLPEFLANMNEAAGDFNAELEGLAALAEAATEVSGAVVYVDDAADQDNSERGLNVSGWEQIFRRAQVMVDELAAGKSQRSKDTRMGDYLGKHLGRSVPIRPRAGSGTATLRRYEGRSRRRLYYFQIVLVEAGESPGALESPTVTRMKASAFQPAFWLPRLIRQGESRLRPETRRSGKKW